MDTSASCARIGIGVGGLNIIVCLAGNGVRNAKGSIAEGSKVLTIICLMSLMFGGGDER